MRKAPPNFQKSWKSLSYWANADRLRQHEDTVLIILTLTIAAAVGLVVVAFILLTENLGSRMYPSGGSTAWRRLAVPVLGSLITGYLLKRHFPAARGSGIPQTKAALFLEGGMIRLRTAVGKFCCSSISLASGIALGREGPSVQVGAGIASTFGRRLGLSSGNIKSLVPIGSAAALAAAFNTPIAAVLFTLEEVMGNLHARVLGTVVLSSATSWMVLRLLLGDEPLFHVPTYQLVHPLEFAFYAFLGITGGIVSVCFVKLLLWLRKHFLRMPKWTETFQPVAGGLLVGILGWFVPDVLGVGYNHVGRALNNQIALGMMALLMVLKVVATAGCYASGNAGGIFGPSLFIGAMMGGAIGSSVHMILPDFTGSVGAYALVGMGAAFAGIVRTPLTSVIMIFEVTRDYSIIVPLMISNLISYFISSRLQKETIYEALLHQDGIYLPTGARDREEMIPVKKGTRSPERILSADERVGDVCRRIDPKQSAWPVCGPSGFMGMLTAAQLADAVKQNRESDRISELLPPVHSGAEPVVQSFPYVYMDEPIDTALSRMANSDLTTLPVLSRADPRRLAGVISLEDILVAYRLPDHKKESPSGEQGGLSRLALLRRILALLIVIIALAGFFTFFYHSRRAGRAQEYFEEGNRLKAADRSQEAIERYRAALSISHSSRDRFALAEALLGVGRLNEASIYLRELIRENANSGPYSLGLARIAAQQGKLQESVEYYHRAIYGSWPEGSARNRIRTRMELVDTFGRFNQRAQAQAELLSVMAEMPKDIAIRIRVGQLLLEYGLPKESSQVFQAVVKDSPGNADAYDGLGKAELARDNWQNAQNAFKSALRLNPDNSLYQEQLYLTEQILSLDPTSRGLSRKQRYEKSRKLLEVSLDALAACLDATPSPPKAASELSEAGRKSLLRRKTPRSYADAVEADLELAGRLWALRIDLCGPPTESDQALARVHARLSR
jgi:CIC family chloride channel protein